MTDDRSHQIFPALKRIPLDERVNSFCRLLEMEVVCRKEKGLDTLRLKRYYRHLFKDREKILSATAFGYGQRLAPLLMELNRRPGPVRILDAGCGYGTESLLFALLENEVTGVELVSERVHLARSRIDFFQSYSSFPLKLTFQVSNVFNFLRRSEPFDLIWVMEAISHIYPAEDFLSLALEKLRNGGKLIVTDPNRFNPLALWRSIAIRGTLGHRPHKKFNDPETGTPVAVGQEQIFSVSQFRKRLIRAGFRVEIVHMSGFMGTSFLPGRILNRNEVFIVLSSLQKTMQNLPFLNQWGSIYTLVASKGEEACRIR